VIALQVAVSGDLEGDFAKFSDHAPKLVEKVIRIVAYRYKKDIRKNYLSGQILGSVTGDLQKSLVAGRKRGTKFTYLVGSKSTKSKAGAISVASLKLSNIYEHEGGYTIKPKNVKALRFLDKSGGYVFVRREIHGQAHPFMTASARAFPWAESFRITEEEVIGKELKRLAKEGIYVPGGLE